MADLNATVLSSVDGSAWPFGLEIEANIEEQSAMLRAIMPKEAVGARVKYAGPFTSEALREAARVLNQAAQLLDTPKRKGKHFVVPQ